MSDEGTGAPTGVSADVIEAFPALDDGAEPIPGPTGLLHETLYLRTAAGREFVLQKVSDVFSPGIHQNIDAVTSHLTRHGVESFVLERTRQGELSFDAGSQGRWRLMTRLRGTTFHTLRSAAQADSAGELVGRFHAALDDFEGELEPMGIPFRDTPLYRARLEEAIAANTAHSHRAEVESIRDEIDRRFEALGPAPATTERVIHGDLKISNVLFEGTEPPLDTRAVALIDFDTLMRAPLWSEWGDAWRSWCNRRGEDEIAAVFDLEVFEASLVGFARGYGQSPSEEEVDSLVRATERIALELATRYATDALEGNYFAWAAERFASAAEHNTLRARGQIALFEAASVSAPERRAILARVFAGG